MWSTGVQLYEVMGLLLSIWLTLASFPDQREREREEKRADFLCLYVCIAKQCVHEGEGVNHVLMNTWLSM